MCFHLHPIHIFTILLIAKHSIFHIKDFSIISSKRTQSTAMENKFKLIQESLWTSTIGGAEAIGSFTTRLRMDVLSVDTDGMISQVDSVW